MLDEQAGELGNAHRPNRIEGQQVSDSMFGRRVLGSTYPDSGGPSRFFYTAKAGRLERELGLLSVSPAEHGIRNDHTTVKPLALMRYLVRLVTPPDGLILDPFCGSGPTIVAAKIEQFRAVGIEQDKRYATIPRAAISVPRLRRLARLADAHRAERLVPAQR